MPRVTSWKQGGSAMPTGTDADAGAQNTCSDTNAPGGTKADCQNVKKVVTISWEKDETWCSEDGPITGTTLNYADGENLGIAVTDHNDGSAVTNLQAPVSGNSFRNVWNVIDVLPTGGPSWNPRRPMDGAASGVLTPQPMDVRFIPNVKRDKKTHSCHYDRTEPGAAASHWVNVACRFELETLNYLLTVYGVLKYVLGWGKYRLQLGDATLTGGFRFLVQRTTGARKTRLPVSSNTGTAPHGRRRRRHGYRITAIILASRSTNRDRVGL